MISALGYGRGDGVLSFAGFLLSLDNGVFYTALLAFSFPFSSSSWKMTVNVGSEVLFNQWFPLCRAPLQRLSSA